MDRKTALQFGLLKYNTGKSCRNGHLSDRYANNGSCVECLRAMNRRAYSNRARRALDAPHSISLDVRNAEHAAHLREYAAQTWAQFAPAQDPDARLRLLLEHVPAEHLKVMGYDIPEHLLSGARPTRLSSFEADKDGRRDAMQGGSS